MFPAQECLYTLNILKLTSFDSGKLLKSSLLAKYCHSVLLFSLIISLLALVLPRSRNIHWPPHISIVKSLSALRYNCTAWGLISWHKRKSVFNFDLSFILAWPREIFGWIIEYRGVLCIGSKAVSRSLLLYEWTIGCIGCRPWDRFISRRVFLQIDLGYNSLISLLRCDAINYSRIFRRQLTLSNLSLDMPKEYILLSLVSGIL